MVTGLWFPNSEHQSPGGLGKACSAGSTPRDADGGNLGCRMGILCLSNKSPNDADFLNQSSHFEKRCYRTQHSTVQWFLTSVLPEALTRKLSKSPLALAAPKAN